MVGHSSKCSRIITPMKSLAVTIPKTTQPKYTAAMAMVSHFETCTSCDECKSHKATKTLLRTELIHRVTYTTFVRYIPAHSGKITSGQPSHLQFNETLRTVSDFQALLTRRIYLVLRLPVQTGDTR